MLHFVFLSTESILTPEYILKNQYFNIEMEVFVYQT